MRKSSHSRMIRRLAPLGLAVALVAIPLAGYSAELGMLDSLAKGAWNLHLRDGGEDQRICLRDGREFIQLRHKQAGCSRFVVEDTANEVVVQYTCRGNGYGRTSIRREGSDVVQIESQGIIDGAPFAMSGEARRNGSC
jgi:hypothetical protein